MIASCRNSLNTSTQQQADLPSPQIQSTEVTVSKVYSGNFIMEVHSNGRAVASQSVDIVYPVQGLINQILVREGDKVYKGQLLAKIDVTELLVEKSKKKYVLEKSRIELDDRLIDYGYRLKDSARVPLTIMQMAKIKSGYQEAVFSYNDLLNSINKANVLSPINGRIADLQARKDNLSSNFSKFCTIIEDRLMNIEFNILETELPYVKMGAKIDVTHTGSEKPFSGIIREINPVVSANGLIRITGEVLNSSSSLMTGMEVDVDIYRPTGKYLYVKKEAVINRANKNVVLSLDQGKAKWNYVRTGPQNRNYITILDGLLPNDTVFVGNHLALADGSPVTPIDESKNGL